jgi:hypothetical protein
MKRFASNSGSFACVLITLLAVGCGGATDASREEPPREEATSGGGGGGAAGTRPVPKRGSLTEECDGKKGLTGESVLDKADVPTTAVFRRFPPEKPYGYTDPSTSSRATFRIRYEGGDVQCTRAGDTSGARRNPTIVPARVAVVVSVDFTTADGLFDEHVVGELSATDGASETVQLVASIPVAALRGSYRKTAEADALGVGVPMKLTGAFAKANLKASEGAMDHGERFVGVFRFDW